MVRRIDGEPQIRNICLSKECPPTHPRFPNRKTSDSRKVFAADQSIIRVHCRLAASRLIRRASAGLLMNEQDEAMGPQGPCQNRRTFLANALAAASALARECSWGASCLPSGRNLAFNLDGLPQSHPLIPALKQGAECLEAMDKVNDYTATFHKRELVGRKMVEAQMELKLRENPFSVYLKFLNPSAGREVAYVNGQNDGKLLVHDVGFASLAGTISLDPTGSYAMSDNRYPITMIGLRNLVSTMMQQWLDQTKLDGVTVNQFPNARIGELSCKAVEATYHEPQAGVKFQTARLYFDSERGLPIRFQGFDFPGRRDKEAQLVEDYFYTNLQLNVGLADLDFSPKNPKYGF